MPHSYNTLSLHSLLQHWSGAILPTSYADLWPQERSLHSACVLVDPKFYSALIDSSKCSHALNDLSDSISHLPHPKLFVMWGVGEDNFELARNAWILDVNSATWTPVINFLWFFHFIANTLSPQFLYCRSSYLLVQLVVNLLWIVIIEVQQKLN